jgi:hypothetical protein
LIEDKIQNIDKVLTIGKMKDFSRESSLGTSVITKGKKIELRVMLMRQKIDVEGSRNDC